MSQNWSEEWKRTKSYLIRSMFADIPMLSPIPERSEVVGDMLSPSDSATRPYSPLPELIIEREKNLHDEPEEYYQMLEKKMLKLYKKMFLEEDVISDSYSSIDTSKSIEYESELSEENDMSIENDEQSMRGDEATQSDSYGESLSSDSNIADASILNDLNVMHETSVESQHSSRTEGEQSSISHTHEVIVTKALVHRELSSDDREDINYNETPEQHVTSPTFTEKSLILVPTKKLYILSKQMGEQPKLTYSVGLVTQAETDQDLQENEEEETEEEQIEVMRLGEANIRSIGSIAGEQTENSKESLTPVSLVERDMYLIQSAETSPVTDYISESSEDPCGLIEISNDFNYSRKRSGSLNKESKIKRKRYETKAVQTCSICREETIWEEVRDNFFCGSPLMFNLCRCHGHKCV